MTSRSAGRHGVAGVDRQVHDDLLELAGVGAHAAEVLAQRDRQPHVLADEAAEHLLHLLDDVVEVADAGLDHLLAAEGEELAGERRGALRGLADLVEPAVVLCAGPSSRGRELAVAEDHAQEVVEVVGDAAGELPDRLHLLGLAELLAPRAGAR